VKCKSCEAYGDYGCRAGFTSIVINGELGCRDADRALDAFHFNQVKDMTVAGMTVYPSGKDHKRRAISRADNIRAMTDEELAAYIGHASLCVTIQDEDGGAWCSQYGDCNECIRDWLRQEVET
jgi:hypothetical protein